MPFVSICIPCYNNPEDVQRLLNSIADQTFRNFEVILSDDSADDAIEKLVSGFAEDHGYLLQTLPSSAPSVNSSYGKTEGHGTLQPPRVPLTIRYHRNTKPLGPIFNWNAAIRSASGDYIKIMFSDDWFTSKESLATFVQLLDDHPAAALAFSGSRQTHLPSGNAAALLHDTSGKDFDRAASEEFITQLRQDFRILFMTNQIGAPSAVIYRRNIAEIHQKNALASSGKIPESSQKKGAACRRNTKTMPTEHDTGNESTPPLFDERSGFASDVFLYMDLLSRNPSFASTSAPLVCIGLHEHQYTESFEEKDPGIYKDYRLLFRQYQLSQSPEYTRYFLRNYLLPYHKGIAEARQLSIPDHLYHEEALAEKRRTVLCWIRSKTHAKGS